MAPNGKNIIQKIGSVIAWPFDHLTIAIGAINSALKAEPALKTAIVGLLAKIQTLATDGTAAATADGLNVSEDVATMTAGAALFTYIKSTFIPQIEAIYAEVKTDVTAAEEPQPAAATA